LYRGFIAQEIKKLMDDHGIDDWEGWEQDPNGSQLISMGDLIVPLVKAVQELSKKVDELSN
jgi:hypothetical protein